MTNERAEQVRDAIQEVIFFSKRWPRRSEEEASLSKAVRCIRNLQAAEFHIAGIDTAAWLQSIKTATVQISRIHDGDEWYRLANQLRQAQDTLWGAVPIQKVFYDPNGSHGQPRTVLDGLSGEATRRNTCQLTPEAISWKQPDSFALARLEAEFGHLGIFCSIEPLRTKLRRRYGSDDAAWQAYRKAIINVGLEVASGRTKIALTARAEFTQVVDELISGLGEIVKWERWREELRSSGLYLSVAPEFQFLERGAFDAQEVIDEVWTVISALSPNDHPSDPGKISDPREAIKHLRELRKWTLEPDSPDGKQPRKPGRRKADFEIVQSESKIAANWERARSAGVAKIDFAKEMKLGNQDLSDLKALDRLLSRVAKRKVRSEK